MTDLIEFALFAALPAELRLQVWKSVPQPTRIISLLPCATCSRPVRARGMFGTAVATSEAEECARLRHRDWRLRWVLHSPRQAVFPPLHACHEARTAWISHYFSPPKYLGLDGGLRPAGNAATAQAQGVSKVRFDMPFVSYESDIFAVFNVGEPFFGVDVDPLLGFDRTRIRNVAIAENAWSLEQVFAAVQPQRLPQLQTVTLLVLGPDPDPYRDGRNSANPGWQEMPAVDVQLFDCDVLEVTDELIAEHPLFGRSRLTHLLFEPEPGMRRLAIYLEFFRAWLWHSSRWDSSKVRTAGEFQWWDFHSYLFDSAFESCPLRDLPQWCPGDHTKHQMAEDIVGLTVNTKLMVERGCMAELTASSVLKLDPTGAYEDFVRLKGDRIARWKRH